MCQSIYSSPPHPFNFNFSLYIIKNPAEKNMLFKRLFLFSKNFQSLHLRFCSFGQKVNMRVIKFMSWGQDLKTICPSLCNSLRTRRCQGYIYADYPHLVVNYDFSRFC